MKEVIYKNSLQQCNIQGKHRTFLSRVLGWSNVLLGKKKKKNDKRKAVNTKM